MNDTLLAPSGADPRIGMTLQDRYRIVRKLGEGGMGAVYEGEHILIRRRVAIKCLHSHFANSPDIVARFHREALAATSIGHPNIIECTDMGRFPDGAFFMVLEFLDGNDWAHALSKTGPQPLSRVVHIMAQVCDALVAAHDKGMIHRDLKPENIFLIQRGGDPDFVKVLDFGIAKMKGPESEEGKSKGLTRTGTAMGTPYYMAPEQAQGKKDIDHRADIYALGVILFQALTGQYPFDDESYPMLVVKICTQEAPSIGQFRTDLPEPIVALVRSMLAKRPSDRPANCAEVKAALAPFAGHDAKPMIAHDAPNTSLAPGTFDPLPAISDPSPPRQPNGSATAPMNGSTPARVATPITRASTATPFAAADDGPIPRASLSEVPGASKTGLWLALGGGGVAIAALAVLGIVMMGGSGPEATQAPVGATAPLEAPPLEAVPHAPEPAHVVAPEAPPIAPVATVRVQISTDPEDAEVYLDDHRISNPFDADLPQNPEPRNLRVQSAGYTTRVQDLVLGEYPQRVVVPLRRGRGVDDRSTHRAPAATGHTGTSVAGHTTAPGGATDTTEARVEPTVEVRTPTVEVRTPIVEVAPVPEPQPEGERHSLKNPFGH